MYYTFFAPFFACNDYLGIKMNGIDQLNENEMS